MASKSNIKIAFASTLKPVDDVRMYEKLTLSGLDILPDISWHLIGFETKNDLKNAPKNIFFYPIFNFSRLSFRRLFANFRFYQLLKKIKPTHLIICSVELLPSAVFFAQKYNIILIYDLQENFYANILYSNTYPFIFRKIIANFIRSIEKWAHKTIHTYLVAEKIYIKEMSFIEPKGIILENKTTIIPTNIHKNTQKKLPNKYIIAGTLGESYGIFLGIDWAIEIQRKIPNFSLTIIGNCAKKSDFQKLEKIAKKYIWIKFLADTKPIPHSIIIENIQKNDILLMPYLPEKHLLQRIPTKFYEGLALQKIMLVQKNIYWQDFFSQFNFKSSIFIDFNSPEDYDFDNNNFEFFYKNFDFPAFIFWENEKKIWQNLLQKICS